MSSTSQSDLTEKNEAQEQGVVRTMKIRNRWRHVRGWLMLPAAMVMIASLLVFGIGAGASTTAPRSLNSSVSANGEWAGVGKVCEPGPGGSSSVRGVGGKTINIAVFNDESNTVEPGQGHEFLQFAKAFASWCNAAGGINGRHIVVDNRDGALFNAAQVTTQACQSDFMAVGGGLVLDAPAVPVREACGLGQITGETVSDAADQATFQVNPNNISPTVVSTGFFPALAKKYAAAVRQAGMGGLNISSAIEPERKWEDAAEAQGWKVQVFQAVPDLVADWTPYIQQLQTHGVQALWPSVTTSGALTAYFHAMNTSGYNPAFILLSTQFYGPQTLQAMKGLHLPPVYVASGWWPFEMASQSPGLEQAVQVMHKYASGDSPDFWDEMAASGWLLWAKSASACGVNLSVSCVLTNAESQKNWSAGGIQAPVAQVTASNKNPVPSPCFILLRAKSNKFVYDKTNTHPTQSIWNCDSTNNYRLTAQQFSALSG
jgi:ABC-type branched-subunit amino acid transport system substrate-binding protein